jgi:oxygen-dependent protoporphyrinogen oxidase
MRSDISHPLNGSGFLVSRASGFAPNGCLWISSLFPDHAPEGRVLLSSYLGGARNPAAAEWDADRSLDAVMQMLRALLGIKADPDMLNIVTHARALPLYHGAYSRRMSVIAERLKKFPGLYLEANYHGGVSVRDRILCADRVTGKILRQQAGNRQQNSRRPNLGLTQDVVPVSAVSR